MEARSLSPNRSDSVYREIWCPPTRTSVSAYREFLLSALRNLASSGSADGNRERGSLVEQQRYWWIHAAADQARSPILICRSLLIRGGQRASRARPPWNQGYPSISSALAIERVPRFARLADRAGYTGQG